MREQFKNINQEHKSLILKDSQYLYYKKGENLSEKDNNTNFLFIIIMKGRIG